MAPALSDAARKPLLDGDPHPRRALTSVGNVSPHMEDDMGLQSAANLSKDSQDMEQMLVELGGTDIGQADLLQAIKTLEGGGDGLSAGDADAIFPLASFERDDLLEAGDSESDVAEDKIRAMQARLERRSSFLLRRMRMHQARAVGKRVSEEMAQTVERCGRAIRRDGGAGRPGGLKSILKRIETTATLQASAAARVKPGPSYYHTGREAAAPSTVLGVAPCTLASSANTAAALRSHLRVVECHLDSDATASSSGAESNDETVPYTNMSREPLPIEKRALWHWQRRRASLAARWSWLQAQVQDLEYKIRQYTDLHRQVRAAKGAVQLEASPGGYEGPLPGQEDTCARVRPLRRDVFRKRKLLQMHNVHIAVPKTAKPADIRCGCQWPLAGCAVCTGRDVAIHPLPPHSTLTPPQRLALLDPGYHPVLSDINDVSPSIHMAALSHQAWWVSRTRSARNSRHIVPAASTPPTPAVNVLLPSAKKRKHSSSKLKKHRSAVGRKSRDADEICSHERGRVRASTGAAPESRRLNSSSYDIDNIVIPPSVAATTRLEILHYKEIPTPKWRVLDVSPQPPVNGVSQHDHDPHTDTDSEEEDTSEASILARHTRAEQTERGKYARNKRTRRSNHQNSTETQVPVPDGTASVNSQPIINTLPAEEDCTSHLSPAETVRPYSPRLFPLEEATYRDMLVDMPRGHPLSCADFESPTPEPEEIMEPLETLEPLEVPENIEEDEPSSPMSPLFYDDDDPDDPEWEQEKEDKR